MDFITEHDIVNRFGLSSQEFVKYFRKQEEELNENIVLERTIITQAPNGGELTVEKYKIKQIKIEYLNQQDQPIVGQLVLKYNDLKERSVKPEDVQKSKYTRNYSDDI